MGIYDRDYYRREGPSFLGSFTERGQVCKWLIGINIVCFIIQMISRVPIPHDGYFPNSGTFTDALILNADKVLHGEVWRLLTAAFLHSTNDIWHIVFNMLFLWWFGSELEELYGWREFLAFYLTAAVVGSIAYVLGSQMGAQVGNALGASGAVTAVLVLAAIHYPSRIIYLFMLLPVPIWAFVVFMVARDAFDFLGRTATNVGVAAHLGGAAFGFLYYKLHWRLTNLIPDLRAWKRRRGQPRLRVYREEETPTPVSVTSAHHAEDEQLEAKMDAILEKISRSGKESLTESENQFLLRASEIFKHRHR
jgi:membrane associated rhomboid family serine protease